MVLLLTTTSRLGLSNYERPLYECIAWRLWNFTKGALRLESRQSGGALCSADLVGMDHLNGPSNDTEGILGDGLGPADILSGRAQGSFGRTLCVSLEILCVAFYVGRLIKAEVGSSQEMYAS